MDGPDVTNGTHIVDVGLLQIEVGGVYSRVDSQRSNFNTPIALRVALTDWLEVHGGSDGLLDSFDAAQHETGAGNLQVGGTVRMWGDPGGPPTVSVQPAMTLPIASPEKGLGSGVADFSLEVLSGSDFLTHAHVDASYGVAWVGVAAGVPRFTQHLASLSFSAEIPGPVTPRVEGAWLSRQDVDGGPVLVVNLGMVYAVNARYAVDVSVEQGLSDRAPALGLSAGMSMVVGNILGGHGVHARRPQTTRRTSLFRKSHRVS